MPSRIIARIQTPADNTGVRKDIHLVTHADAVIVDETMTLSEKLRDIDTNGTGGTKFEMSETKPDHSCVWAQILKTEEGTPEETPVAPTV